MEQLKLDMEQLKGDNFALVAEKAAALAEIEALKAAQSSIVQASVPADTAGSSHSSA